MLKINDFSATHNEAIITKAIHKIAHFHQQCYKANLD